MFGQDPPTLLSYEPGLSRVIALDKQLQQRDEFLAEIRERLLQAQDYMKVSYDKKHREVEFEVGEWAWLRLHQRQAAGITSGGNQKLAPRYYGPYKVLEKVGNLAYRLLLPPKARIHDVFHVVFLKKFQGDPPTDIVPLPVIAHGQALPEPATISRAKPNGDSWDILVQWVGRGPAEATWESLESLKERYPDFQLEDKLFSQEGGSVVNNFFGKKFQRRQKKSKPNVAQG